MAQIKTKLNIRVEIDFYHLIIYLDNTLHLKLRLKELQAIQSWVDRKDKFCIEYSFRKKGRLITEYINVDVWKELLKQLEQVNLN